VAEISLTYPQMLFGNVAWGDYEGVWCAVVQTIGQCYCTTGQRVGIGGNSRMLDLDGKVLVKVKERFVATFRRRTSAFVKYCQLCLLHRSE
jgi:hypothetical protein